VNGQPLSNFTSRYAYQILSYLAEHPTAGDTREGIVHWWLLEQKIKYMTAEVESALNELVAHGLLIEQRQEDGRVHYRIDQQKAGEIEVLLERSAEQPRDTP
jgi:hypothetical protein